MAFVSSFIPHVAAANLLLQAILASVAGIALLLAFIALRRWWRGRYFARRERQMLFFREHWDDLLSGQLRPQHWRFDNLAGEVLETMLLDRLEVAAAPELPPLVACLRRSGLLDKRIAEARVLRGWRRWRALVMLGRTRAREAVPALADALSDSNMETRIAAVRGLGKLALAAGAVPILERFCDGELFVPWTVLKNALLACCARDPELLLRYLRVTAGTCRELLARVLAEIADGSMAGELLLLAGDASAEVRAAAARALAHSAPRVALPPLAQLAADREWFVRLRAVVSLGSFATAETVPVLVRALGDRHRAVRLRAAWALLNSNQRLLDVLRQVVAAGDNYGVQALVSELETCGKFGAAMAQLNGCAAPDADRIVATLQQAHARLQLGEPLPEPEEVRAC